MSNTEKKYELSPESAHVFSWCVDHVLSKVPVRELFEDVFFGMDEDKAEQIEDEIYLTINKMKKQYEEAKQRREG